MDTYITVYAVLITLLLPAALILAARYQIQYDMARAAKHVAIKNHKASDDALDTARYDLEEERADHQRTTDKLKAAETFIETNGSYIHETRALFLASVQAFNDLGYGISVDGKQMILTPHDGDEHKVYSVEVH